VVGAGIGGRERDHARGAERERDHRACDRARVPRGHSREGRPLEQLADQHARGGELGVDAGHADAVEAAGGPREPLLRGPHVLEIELVEHALARLAQERAGVQCSEHAVQRRPERVE
jgi:hypothetical protein